MSDTWVTIGKIGRPHGVRGGVHVHLSAQSPDDMSHLLNWQLRFPDGRIDAVTVESIRPHGQQGVVATLVDVTDRDQAMSLTHALIEISRDALPPLPEDTFYWVDLIHLKVVTTAGDVLGEVTECIDNGAQTVLLVSGTQRYQIPFAWQDTIQAVEDEQIIVDWPVEATST